MAKKAKKKAASKWKRRVSMNDYVTTYKVVPVMRYEVLVSCDRYGKTTKSSYGVFARSNVALRYAYENALSEREARHLEQGDMRVIFPNGIEKS